MLYHHEKADIAVSRLGSDVSLGLRQAQVSERLVQYGENKLREKKKKTNLQRFAEQFKDVMIDSHRRRRGFFCYRLRGAEPAGVL